MKRTFLISAAVATLFTLNAVASASPDFNKPATETGVLQMHEDDYYINNYELDDLNVDQKYKLKGLVGKKITIKGFYELVKPFEQADELYVSEIIVSDYDDDKKVEQVKIYGPANPNPDAKPDVQDAVKK